MTSGMAGVAGTILAAYASMGIRIDYLLAASFMAAPGGILMAKIIMPDRADAAGGRTAARRRCPSERRRASRSPQATHDEEKPANIIMAAAQGAQTGVQAGGRGRRDGAGVRRAGRARQRPARRASAAGSAIPDLSFQGLLGYVFAPVMFLLNVPWNEAGIAGGLFGEKIVLNEFVAYIDLGKQQRR